jgi:hypothetical protein
MNIVKAVLSFWLFVCGRGSYDRGVVSLWFAGLVVDVSLGEFYVCDARRSN